jgi:tRNA threonylcarbamoyladenosine biosynthesis protein TsaE
MVEILDNQLSLTCSSLKDLPEIARRILNFGGKAKVISFEGELGAGKTTLIKEICKILGVEDNVSSPTFAIINEYLDSGDNPVYHFDFYRVKNIEEGMDIGTEDYFYSGDVCLIEWPQMVADLIPEESIFVNIEVKGEETRVFHLKRHD